MGYYEDLNNGKVGKSSDAHYISAYGIAVKHGFTGSEEEWLESLSDYGIAKKHGFTGSEEEWNEAVNDARNKAEAAKTAAEAARDDAVSAMTTAESHENEAYKHSQNSKEYASSASESANSANIYMRMAEGYSLSAETAKTDAERARDEAEAVKSDIEKIAGELSGYVKASDIFKNEAFTWTDFGYTLPTNDGGASYVNENALNVGGTDQPIVVHCAGKTLGFTFSINGFEDAYLKINGITTKYTNSAYDGSEFATNIIILPTYMELDIEFSGGMNVWTFTDMTIQSIKDVSELEEQIGDIDSALDAIIAIADALIEGDG